jgi:hypothetical protein
MGGFIYETPWNTAGENVLSLVEHTNQGSRGDTTTAKNKYIKDEIDKIVESLPFNPLFNYDKPPRKSRKTSKSATVREVHRHKINTDKERNRLLSSMRRLNKLQRTVGWVGIIFMDAFSPIVQRDISEVAFDLLLESFLTVRPDIIKVVKQAWPSYPPVLEDIGGFVLHKLF